MPTGGLSAPPPTLRSALLSAPAGVCRRPRAGAWAGQQRHSSCRPPLLRAPAAGAAAPQHGGAACPAPLRAPRSCRLRLTSARGGGRGRCLCRPPVWLAAQRTETHC